jgi:hypothetical protein
MANDLSTHSVMAVLDTAIHALLFESRRLDESEPRLIGIIPNDAGFDSSTPSWPGLTGPSTPLLDHNDSLVF